MDRMRRRTGILVLIVAVLLVPLHRFGVLQPVEQGIVLSVRPLQRLLYGILPAPRTQQATPERLAELERAVANLTVENARLTALHSAAKDRDALTALLAERGMRGVTATVIGRSTTGSGQLFILDRGADQGIRAGQPVVAGTGILVGIVERAEAGRSTIGLLTNAGRQVAAEVQNASRSPGILAGQHSLTMVLQFIPQQEPIAVGQTVVTAAVDERIPANLVIGEISTIDFATDDLFQEAAVRPLLDPQRVRTVTVLTP